MNSNKKRILVVDDEQTVTRMLKLNLEETGGYEVATENDPRQVLHKVRTFHPDLVILDILMPDMTGDYVAQQLRDIPSCKEMPILFLTAIGDGSDWPCAPDRDPVIRKPVDMSKLLPVIRERLASSRMPSMPVVMPAEVESSDPRARQQIGANPAG